MNFLLSINKKSLFILITCFITFIIIFFAFSLINNENSTPNQNIDLKPKIKFEEKIKDYFIEGSKLYILVENEKENAQLLQVYDLNTGKKLNRIKLK